MSNQSALPRLHLSAPHPCPYIQSETATTVLLDPRHPVDNNLFSILMRGGFRRSGDAVYRPHCRSCNACVSVRIPAGEYRPNRAQRRVYEKNRDLHTTLVPARFDEEHFALYCRYQSWRHRGDLMDHSDPQRYRAFMVESPIETVFIEHRLAGELAALSVCDLPDDGLSAVYTFFEPKLQARSLGTYAIMKQLDYVNAMGLEWLYLGYWIDNCRKMAYKTNFKPIFGYVNGEWRILRL